MRLNLTLFILLLLSCTANAQKLTGIWRGYFSSSGGIYKGNTREETYKYEIQIDQQSNSGVVGVTYSYKTTVFYGKAELQGIFTQGSKSMVFKETKLVDIKIGDKSEPCLMTCYLDYTKIGKLEVLEGTFISINVKDKSDCGSGKVYLERVATSDFKLEDFLVKKKTHDSDKVSGKVIIDDIAKNKPKPTFTPPSTTPERKDNLVTKPVPLKPPATNTQKPTTVVPKIAPPVVKKQDPKVVTGKNKTAPKNVELPTITVRPTERIQEESVNSKNTQEATLPQVEMQNRTITVPKILQERENKLAKVITTSEEILEIALYDNGTIDNDTITVYHNNQMVVNHGRLSNTPIIIKIKSSKTDNHHELVVVADNLGEIPPNTAMMIINPSGGKDRIEVFIASNEQKNAKVVINYVPKPDH